MKIQEEQFKLYAITDRRWHREKLLWEMVEEAIEGGVTMVQLREKEIKGEDLEEEACQVRDVCRNHDIPFIINDDVELAIKIGADGVHVGQSDTSPELIRECMGENFIIGVTTKTAEQARRAEVQGADYLGSGAVFGTASKVDAVPMTLQRLQEICQSVSIPVVAIGGIEAENIAQLSGVGIAGAAVLSGIFSAENIRQAAAFLRQEIEKGWHDD